MKVYTYFEARQSLASILDEAYRSLEGGGGWNPPQRWTYVCHAA